MKKVFVSQPMSKYTDDQIRQNRNMAISILAEFFKLSNQMEFEVIDNIQETNPDIEKLPHKNLGYLANDIRDMANADMAFFMNDWENARGCRIEHRCCEESNIPILYERDALFFISSVKDKQ